jgi:replicative DNA helicase
MTTKGSATEIRTWFDEHGWQLEPGELRAALSEQGADMETIVELVDDAADRQRQAQPDDADARRAHLIVAPAEYVLGAMVLAGSTGPDIAAATLEKIRATGLTAPMFPRQRDKLIYAAIERVVDDGRACEFMSIEAQLRAAGALDDAGGAEYVRALARLVPVVANASTYASLVVEEHRRAEQQRLALELQRASQNGGVTDHLRNEIIQVLEPSHDLGAAPEAITAGTFIFDEPLDTDSIRVWGHDSSIGWAAGEGLMLVGPDGVGKTTVGQQLALARAGLRPDVLGHPVTASGRRVLYLACDRPRQAARSLRRMVVDSERDQLDEAMTVWRGPLPQMLNEDRTVLTRLARQFDAGTVVIDSLKDVAFDLSTDEAGGRIASAFQHLIASEVELLVLHHPRKPGVEQSRKPRELADVYGSRLIFGVFGSVIMLWGDPGDVLVELHHLKQPIDEIGPWTLRHDHRAGHTTVEKGTDLVDVVLHTGTDGITAAVAAGLVYGKDTPTKAEVERIRYRLDQLTESGRLVKYPGRTGGLRGGEHSRYLYNGPAEALQ